MTNILKTASYTFDNVLLNFCSEISLKIKLKQNESVFKVNILLQNRKFLKYNKITLRLKLHLFYS